MSRTSLGALSLSLVASLLSACSLAPTYKPPATEEVSRYKEAGDWAPAQPADAQQRGPWWEVFGDLKLNDLEKQLNAANPDLQAAVARFEQARAVARQDISNEFPTLGLGASATRARSSASAPLANLAGNVPVTSNNFLATLNLNWEIDLFGRLRNTAAAVRAAAQGSEADTVAVALSLQAELASEYFSLRGDDTTIALLADTIKVYDRAYELTSNRYREGIAAATDVDQADTLRQNARAQLASVRRERAQLEHAIAVLLGVMPSTFALEPAQLASSVPALDSGVPSALLQRRPDVARAERAVAAANAQIGVARAAWFPVFTLTGEGGFQSIDSSQWFKAPSRLWSLGPTAAVPLLDFGARSAVNQQARASYDEAAANYRKTALTAYREVEDNLAALHHLADEVTADEAASKSAASAANHSDKRYDAGVADYIEVTTTHTAALQEERDAISARVLQLNAAVALVRATGGGWTRDRIGNL
ncbi:MAG TPA: efflux transporter outer membrane subunit [Steroidobacteraceae bacterium]|nr:efflux transporter outer membrane subunit [Steroidobacteraceae bacterium]